MKKVLWIGLMILLLGLSLFACAEADRKTDSCKHSWTLTAFVTEETEVDFAGVFYCSKCQKEDIRSFSYTDIEIPLVSLVGDVSPFRSDSGRYNKEVKVSAEFKYQSAEFSLECNATLKLQGKSTASDDKYNFSVNLLESDSGEAKRVAFQEAWGNGYKYVLKSNYCDPSAVRNISCASIYGQAAHTREIDDHYSDLVNCGGVDGYPVLLYVNGKYQGLYNWVIRKDKWLYGMGNESAGEAVLAGSDMDVYTSEEGLVILPEGMASAKSWEEEYVNEKYGQEGWAEASFNEMLFKIRGAQASELPSVIAEYLEVERTIDVLLFNSIFGTADSITGNQVWCTFDGKKWAPVVYDYDRALGRSGNCLMDPQEDINETLEQNYLYNTIFHACYEEIKARYCTLRESVFTEENIRTIIDEKMDGLDDRYFKAELEKWPNATWLDSEESAEITSFEKELEVIDEYVAARLSYCDVFFGRVSA